MLHGQQIEQIGVAVTVCTCIRQVPSSNIGRDADYREDVFRDFPESLHENQGVSTSRRPQQPTFKSLLPNNDSPQLSTLYDTKLEYHHVY